MLTGVHVLNFIVRNKLFIVLIDIYCKSVVKFTSGTLQKQVGCFNHRVVALVADRLEGHAVVVRGLL